MLLRRLNEPEWRELYGLFDYGRLLSHARSVAVRANTDKGGEQWKAALSRFM
jgi:hypothetical protein